MLFFSVFFTSRWYSQFIWNCSSFLGWIKCQSYHQRKWCTCAWKWKRTATVYQRQLRRREKWLRVGRSGKEKLFYTFYVSKWRGECWGSIQSQVYVIDVDTAYPCPKAAAASVYMPNALIFVSSLFWTPVILYVFCRLRHLICIC